MNLIVVFLFVWLSGVVYWDLSARKVPNFWVCVAVAAWVMLQVFGQHGSPVSWMDGALGGLAAFAVLLLLYVIGWMGAGDVKFALALGLWSGLSINLVWIWVGGSLLAGLHSLGVLIFATFRNNALVIFLTDRVGLEREARESSIPLDFRLNLGIRRKRSAPYAAYMAIAAIYLLVVGALGY